MDHPCHALWPYKCTDQFCTLLNKILAPFLNYFVVVYLDDIVIYSKILQEHVGPWKVFQTLRDLQLYVKKEKCSFA